MANTYNGPAFQGVPLGSNFTSVFPTPQRITVLIPEVPLNNIRLLGILDLQRNWPTSDGLRLSTLVQYELRRRYEAISFVENYDIQPGDFWQIIPLYDFARIDFRVGLP